MDEIEVVVPDDVWLIIHMGPAAYVWNLGQLSIDEQADATMAARAAVGFQPDDDWVRAPHESAVMVTFGRPHPSLMNRATIGTAEELAAVDPAAVAAYLAEYAKRPALEANDGHISAA